MIKSLDFIGYLFGNIHLLNLARWTAGIVQLGEGGLRVEVENLQGIFAVSIKLRWFGASLLQNTVTGLNKLGKSFGRPKRMNHNVQKYSGHTRLLT